MEPIAAILAGGAVFLLLAYMIRARALRPAEARIKYLAATRAVTIDKDASGQTLLRRESSAIPALNRFLTTRGYAERWAADLERADLALRPGEYFLIRLALAGATAAIFALIVRGAIGVIVGIVIGAMMYTLPAYWLQFRIKRRLRKINSQLVETITLIANALRSGFAFAQGIDVAAKRVGPPMSAELNRLLLDINLGASIEDALRGMNERIRSDDLDMVITAILIQRQSGGNLAEVLESVTETMRDRERIEGEIKTLTAQQRLTGWVLSVWPALLGLGFFAINPKMMSLLWTTAPGIVLLVVWLVLNSLGIFTIRRILDIDI